jgi:hypothetical protein
MFVDRPEEKKNELGAGKMDEFEELLTRELQRVDAPEGFALRVLDLAAKQTPVRARVLTMPVWMARPHAWAGGAIAAALVLGCFAAERIHVRQQQEKAEMAQQQFDTAMRVTDRALGQTRAHLERAGFKLGD